MKFIELDFIEKFKNKSTFRLNYFKTLQKLFMNGASKKALYV